MVDASFKPSNFSKKSTYHLHISAALVDDTESSPEPDVTVSQLPTYDLPEKRQKTNVKKYETKEYTVKTKPKKTKEESPVDWQRLQPKEEEEWDVTNYIVLGKGQKPGIISLGSTVSMVSKNAGNVLFIFVLIF